MFPRLVHDPAYTDFVYEARVQASADLRNVAKLRASLSNSDIRSRMAVDESTLGLRLLKGVTPYRAASTLAKVPARGRPPAIQSYSLAA